MQILWIRHGQTQGNVERRYVGRTDEGLTADAKEKLKMRKQQGIGFEADLIYVSPMIRCRDTADLLFPEQRKVPWDGLQETDFGDFEYKNYEELKDDPLYQVWIDSNGQMLIPNGESGADFRRRCCAAYEKCVQGKKVWRRLQLCAMVVQLCLLWSDTACRKNLFMNGRLPMDVGF